MARVAYLDCFSGVSGDMLLGAMLDAGLPLADLRAELKKLRLSGCSVGVEKVKRGGLASTRALVEVTGEQPRRTLADIEGLIQGSDLQETDAGKAVAVFRRLAQAEAAVHGETIESVHLHEVGAADAIMDVVGAVVGLRILGVEEVFASALPLGSGETAGRHGSLPVPAPATLELIARAHAPVRVSADSARELVTPTGAAIVTAVARFERPEMTIERVGYGAGARDPADRPNVVRLWLGESLAAGGARRMVLVETNVDDMTGEALGYALEKLLASSAADAWLTPVQMKKNRPGVMVSVLCHDADEEAIVRLILRETSTLGVRVRSIRRWEAERGPMEFECSLGPAVVKVKRLPGEAPLVAPEYEACKRLAEESGLPLGEVYRIVQAEAGSRLASRGS